MTDRLKGHALRFLIPEFLEAMNDIGRYGFEKYGDDSFQARRSKGDTSRGPLGRCQSQAIADHARGHFNQYLNYVAHDHFHTDKHQLAAVAFNAMMEFYFAGLNATRTRLPDKAAVAVLPSATDLDAVAAEQSIAERTRQ